MITPQLRVINILSADNDGGDSFSVYNGLVEAANTSKTHEERDFFLEFLKAYLENLSKGHRNLLEQVGSPLNVHWKEAKP